jgi:hypothetical protein
MGNNKHKPPQVPTQGQAQPDPNAPQAQPDPIVIAAQAAHEANRAYCQSIGDDSQVAWGDAPDWQKESAIKGVVFAIDNNFPSPEAMHGSWCAEKLANGWVYGEVKDAEKKTHYCLVDYAALPQAQRKKDDIFLATIKQSLSENGIGPNLQTPEPTHEDDAQLAGHEGTAIYELEWNECLALAFAGTGADVLTDWGAVPLTMVSFIKDHPDAPDEAVLIHVRLTDKVVVLPNEDPRRVQLAVKLFRHWLQGLVAIQTEDMEAAKRAAEQKAYASMPLPKMDEDSPFAVEAGGLDALSDLGKAVAAQQAPQG